MRRKLLYGVVLVAVVLLATSCYNTYYPIGVVYQTLAAKQPTADLKNPPANAKIAIGVQVVGKGNYYNVIVNVHNLTDSTLVIDKSMSFFRNPEGISTSYYDPTVRTSSTSSTTSTASGVGVNLGLVTVGGGKGNANTNVNTTQSIDLTHIAIAPHGHSDLGHIFSANGFGEDKGAEVLNSLIGKSQSLVSANLNYDNSFFTFGVKVSYSFDNGATYDAITGDFYAKDYYASHVTEYGQLNDALRNIYSEKPDVLNEPWYNFYSYTANRRNKEAFDGTYNVRGWYSGETSVLIKHNEFYIFK